MGVAVREKQTGSGIYWLFIRHAGERVSQMVGDKETAEDAAKDIRKDIWRGKFDIAAMKAARAKEKRDEKPNIPTLKEYFDRFERDSLALAVGESTQDVYSNAFNRHLIPTTIPESPELEDSPVKAFGEFRLSEISRAHIKVLINALLRKKCSRLVNVTAIDDGGNEITTKKAREFHLSKSSLRITLAALLACLNNAVREDNLIPNNPAAAFGRFIKRAKPRHESIDPLQPPEVPLFLEAVRQTAPDFFPMFVILLHTGIRSGECAGLKWGDEDLKNKYLLVQRTFTPKGRVKLPKSGKTRKVDLSDVAIAALKAHRARLQAQLLRKKIDENEKEPKHLSEWMFPNSEGKPHNMTNVRNRIFYRALQEAGLHRRPLHALRHTFATLLLHDGVSPVKVQELMGHHSITVTCNVYKHWIPSEDRTAVNRLPSLDTPKAAVAVAGD